MREFLGLVQNLGLRFKYKIWDKNADYIGSIEGFKVDLPDNSAVKNSTMIVMIEETETYCAIKLGIV